LYPYTEGYSGYVASKLSNERGWRYNYSYTGTGANRWWTPDLCTFTFTAGKTYNYKMKVRCNTCTAGALHFRAARYGNDYGGCATIAICTPSLADGQWHEYSLL
jgi:ssDNA-binding Zn-finger/Zn-ribbon topoisomerase 1